MDGDPIEPGKPLMTFSLYSIRPCSPNPVPNCPAHSLSKQPGSTLLADQHLCPCPLLKAETVLKKRLREGVVEEVDGAGANLSALSFELDSAVFMKTHKGGLGMHQLHDVLRRVTALVGQGACTAMGATMAARVASFTEDMKALWSHEAVRVAEAAKDQDGRLSGILPRRPRAHNTTKLQALRQWHCPYLSMTPSVFQNPPQNNVLFAGGMRTRSGRCTTLEGRGQWLSSSPPQRLVGVHTFLRTLILLTNYPSSISCCDERLTEHSKINRFKDYMPPLNINLCLQAAGEHDDNPVSQQLRPPMEKAQGWDVSEEVLPGYGQRPNDVNAVVNT